MGSDTVAVDLTAAEDAFRSFLTAIGHNPDTDDHLADTPRRVTQMYADLLSGGQPFTFTTFPVDPSTDQMILVGEIPFTSFCAHHLLPFTGVAHVAYIPDGTIAGLSKFARLVNHLSARPQVQERLTAQVADEIERHLAPLGVAVMMEARHACMEARGVRAHGAVTRTTVLRGIFITTDEARQEFFAAVGPMRS